MCLISPLCATARPCQPSVLKCGDLFLHVASKKPNSKVLSSEPARLGKGKVLHCPSEEAPSRDGNPLCSPSVMPGPISFRETKVKKELLGLRGPLDPLGPGALLVILEKMAPREHKAQR